MSQEQFSNEYPQFQAKMANFLLSNGFDEKATQYEKLFNEMSSIAPDDMKEYIQRSPEFLNLRNRSLALMERIVAIHKGLQDLFASSQESLGKKYNYDLKQVDAHIGKELKQVAQMIHQFETISEQGRDLLKKLDDPFLSQAL